MEQLLRHGLIADLSVNLLKLDDEASCLAVLAPFEGQSVLKRSLEESFPSTPLLIGQIDKALHKKPAAVLLGCPGMLELVALLDHLRPQLAEACNLVVVLESFSEEDVLELMNQGVESVLSAEQEFGLLRAALLKAVQQALARRRQAAEFRDLTETATTAMRAASEIGMLLQYLQQTSHVGNVLDLLEVSLTLLRNLGLKGCISCLLSGSQYKVSTEGEPTPIQETLLASLTERIVHKGRILGLSSSTSSWVCSGAMLADEEAGGRMRDILIQALDILDAKLRSLEMINLIREQYNQVFDVIELIKNSQNDSQRATQYIMKRLASDIELAAVSLDLDERQEAFLLDLSNKALDQLDHLHTGFNLLEGHFERVLEGLERARAVAEEQCEARAPEASLGVGGGAVDLF